MAAVWLLNLAISRLIHDQTNFDVVLPFSLHKKQMSHISGQFATLFPGHAAVKRGRSWRYLRNLEQRAVELLTCKITRYRVPKTNPETMMCLSHAALLGNLSAMYNLAWHYEQLDNTPLAVKYYQEASDRGLKIATLNLSELYMKTPSTLVLGLEMVLDFWERGYFLDTCVHFPSTEECFVTADTLVKKRGFDNLISFYHHYVDMYREPEEGLSASVMDEEEEEEEHQEVAEPNVV